MADTTPHLTIPLTVVGGKFVTTEQGSARHVADQAEVICRTRPGTLEVDPDFGLRDLVARTGPVAPEIRAALEEWVPDAQFLVTEEQETVNTRIRNVAVEIAEES